MDEIANFIASLAATLVSIVTIFLTLYATYNFYIAYKEENRRKAKDKEIRSILNRMEKEQK